MLLAAADPTGDATLLWRAAPMLGLGRDAATAADAEQLLEIGSRVRFRHPLVRSAAYAAGSTPDRRAAHLALAASTDARADPERRVWHLAAAASGPDEDVAVELERAAGTSPGSRRAGGRGRFPPTLGRLDRRPGTTRRASPGRRSCATCTPAPSMPPSACWPRPRPTRSTISSAPAWSSSGDRSTMHPAPGREAPARLLRAAKRLEPLELGSPGTPTWTHSSHPSSPVHWHSPEAARPRSPEPHDRRRRRRKAPGPATCSSTAWQR